MNSSRLRRAGLADLPAIERLIEVAFTPYIERIGRPPGPMSADYARALTDSRVWVVEGSDRLDGVLVLETHDDHLLVDVIAVDPAAQGRGVGVALLDRAESDARALGLGELRLYTNEAMTENLDYYPRRGFEETGRRVDEGFRRVYFRKPVALHV